MKTWGFEAYGVYLGAYGVVIAETEEQAMAPVLDILRKAGLEARQDERDPIKLKEVTPGTALLLCNGDY